MEIMSSHLIRLGVPFLSTFKEITDKLQFSIPSISDGRKHTPLLLKNLDIQISLFQVLQHNQLYPKLHYNGTST